MLVLAAAPNIQAANAICLFMHVVIVYLDWGTNTGSDAKWPFGGNHEDSIAAPATPVSTLDIPWC